MQKKRLIIILILGIICGLIASGIVHRKLGRRIDPPKNYEIGEEESELDLEDQYNILLLGLDADFGGTNRTDTIIYATIDTKAKKAKLLSIPRDTRVKIKGAWDKINAAYVYGGTELIRTTVEEFLDKKIDNHVIVNFESLIEIVDTLGGLDIDVPIRMYYPAEGINLHPGEQHLGGKDVLAYTRYRYTDEGDIGRAKRQQEVIELIVEKIKTASIIKNVEIGRTILKNIETDMPATEVLKLLTAAPKILENGIEKSILPGENQKIDGIWYWEPAAG